MPVVTDLQVVGYSSDVLGAPMLVAANMVPAAGTAPGSSASQAHSQQPSQSQQRSTAAPTHALPGSTAATSAQPAPAPGQGSPDGLASGDGDGAGDAKLQQLLAGIASSNQRTRVKVSQQRGRGVASGAGLLCRSA